MPPFSKQCLLEVSNCNLTFYKTRQLATWLQVSPKCQVQTGFQAYSSKKKIKFILSIKIPVIPPPATSNWICYNKMADQGIEILIIQGSDLWLGTQEYFQFSVSSPSWGSPMPHLTGRNPAAQQALISWLSMHWSRDCSRTDHLTDHAMITWL